MRVICGLDEYLRGKREATAPYDRGQATAFKPCLGDLHIGLQIGTILPTDARHRLAGLTNGECTMRAAFDVAAEIVTCIDTFQDVGASDDFGRQALRQHVPAFSAAFEQFEASLSDDLLAAVRDRRPLVVNGRSARSYLEIVHSVACEWFKTLLFSADSGELGSWTRRELWPAIDVEAVISNWRDWCKRAPLVGTIDTMQLRVGLDGEREALAAHTESHEKTTDRIRLGANNVVVLAHKEFSVKPNGYKLFDLLLEAPGEYVSLASHGLRTRDVESLPAELRDAIESGPGAGTRIKREYLA